MEITEWVTAIRPRPKNVLILKIGNTPGIGYTWERHAKHAKENLYSRTNYQKAERSRSTDQPHLPGVLRKGQTVSAGCLAVGVKDYDCNSSTLRFVMKEYHG